MTDAREEPVFRGRFFDGRTARAADVVLDGKVTSLSLLDATTGEELVNWPYYRMRALPRPDRRDPLSIGLLDSVHDPDRMSEARLIVEDAKAAQWLASVAPDIHKKPPFGWHAARPYLLWSGGALASLAFLFWIGIPMLAGTIAATVPDKAQASLGKLVERQIIARLAHVAGATPETLVCDGAAGRAAVDRMMAPLLASMPDGVPVTITVIDHKLVNAFALPGGRILVFKGLLDFVDHPNALAGVLAHELGHAAGNHPMRGVLEKSAAGVMIGLLLGDVAGGTVIAAAAEFATNAAYSREMESEADRFAVAAMQQAGWDVTPFAGFFEALHREHGDVEGMLGFLSTHPPSEERRAVVTRAADGTGGNAASDADWKSILTMCG